jgi:Fur family ferric uptake transcriptional regulator
VPQRPSSGNARELDRIRARLLTKLQRYVSEKALKQSGVREAVLEAVLEMPRHFTAQELVLTLADSHPKLGRATIYRALGTFVEAGLIQEGPSWGEDRSVYELMPESEGPESALTHHHDHLICSDCLAIFEFHDDLIEDRQNQIAKSMKFKISEHRHIVFASCELLRKN